MNREMITYPYLLHILRLEPIVFLEAVYEEIRKSGKS